MKTDLVTDVKANAAYLKISRNKIAKTTVVSSSINIDYDLSGNVVGIEFLNVGWTADQIRTSYGQGYVDGLVEGRKLIVENEDEVQVLIKLRKLISVSTNKLNRLRNGKEK